MPNKIWIDVEDLFQYAALNPRPSGIQRIEYELCRSLAALPESSEHVRFVRHAGAQKSFYAIPYGEIDALYAGMTRGHGSDEPRTGRQQTPLSANPLRRLAYKVPPGLRSPLIAFLMAQRAAAQALREVGRALVHGLSHRGPRWLRHLRPAPAKADRAAAPLPGSTAFDTGCRPGDVLLVLGSPWFHPFYSELVQRVQTRRGLRFALLVYDIIPLRRPEWCDHNLVLRFREWTSAVFPLVDIFLTISRFSADDIVEMAQRSGYQLRHAPQPIPIGTGFGASSRPPDPPASQAPPRKLPRDGYALIVSTIEARKNHTLLFRIWRRLIEEMPRERIPTLVFAGRVGWLVSDLMQQLRNTNFLDGKIVLIEDPSDDELERLYAGCRFTLFPSLYEGWGLPVTESLSFGKPCLISRATALPEAGGDLARYFDPENGGEAYDVIRRAIETPEDVAAWAAAVRRDFRPVTWDQSARGVLRALGLATADAGTNDMEVTHPAP